MQKAKKKKFLTLPKLLFLSTIKKKKRKQKEILTLTSENDCKCYMSLLEISPYITCEKSIHIIKSIQGLSRSKPRLLVSQSHIMLLSFNQKLIL